MRRTFSALMAALLLVGGGVATAQASSSMSLRGARWINVHGRWVFGVPLTIHPGRTDATVAQVPWKDLQNLGTGLCMSAWPDKKGQPATQQRCNGSLNQQWVYGWDGPGLALINAGMGYGTTTEWCLDNYQGRLSNGNPQIMWPCRAKPWTWAINYYQGGSAFTDGVLIHTNSWHGNYCVTTLGSTTVGSPMEEWLCNKYSRNQAFK